MKIYNSTEYVDLTTKPEPWLKLDVTNQWDFKTKSICSKKLTNDFVCYYHLTINTYVSDTQYTCEVVNEITDEIKNELAKMGYNVF